MPELTVESMLASLASTYPDCPQIAEQELRQELAEKLDRYTPQAVSDAIEAIACWRQTQGRSLTRLPAIDRLQTACQVAQCLSQTRFERAMRNARLASPEQTAGKLPPSAGDRLSARMDEWAAANYEQAGPWLEAVATMPLEDQEHLLKQVNVCLMSILGPTFELDREHWTDLHAVMLSILADIGLARVPIGNTRQHADPMPVGGWPWSQK